MDWDALFNYLGTGGGLIVLLNWLAGLPLLRKKKQLEKEDVSRQMAERDNQTILWLYDQVQEFRGRMYRLEGMVEKLSNCPHWDRCPARVLVSDYKRKYFYPKGRQHPMEQKGIRHPRSDPGEDITPANPDGQPPCPG